MEKTFFIKNMVCDRCIKVVTDELKDKNIDLFEIELGRIKLNIQDTDYRETLVSILEKNGFSVIESPEKQLVEQVKIELIKLLKNLPLDINRKLSKYLEEKLNREYSKTSKLFSIMEGITIEKYFIKLKIEKVKELIQNQEFNFTEIGQILNYSNINHLSRQFKTETGMSLTIYKSQQINDRTSLDRII
ncbi:AraC family transcriptional regulator [Arenibacter sp. ARW7G5Y1]|uniref:helix-turn-helix domain-containing protein n=1 Tax=Arenibacter sp. ARW7G5Y1 TaxID=2135619 RepID=UPI000D75AF3A|nr:AraC family transcriptional regulator [Arenibacter sp. ARW7G5Y1]PXX28169.1 AraC-like DNA-binding protein [Arenibacter sp. ARW7G5Y1]|tara:strand:- start:623 stop:1189 length:567 start_codon:yes stop_codon:yes gene_type:complete